MQRDKLEFVVENVSYLRMCQRLAEAEEGLDRCKLAPCLGAPTLSISEQRLLNDQTNTAGKV